MAFILVYVDDLLILCADDTEKDEIIMNLEKFYEIRSSDGVEQFLGVQMIWTLSGSRIRNSLLMRQSLYSEGILRRFGMENSKPAATPMVESFFNGLSSEVDRSPVDVERYQSMIGSLLYLALRTRIDLLAPVLILARFQKTPTAYCHCAVKRVLRFLRGTTNEGLLFRRGNSDLGTYVDADFAGDVVDRKSMSGYAIKVGDAVCIWGAKKQATVSLSTCEAEYHALSLAAQETVWVRRLMEEIGMDVHGATPVKSDNQSAIAWATGERCPSNRAKHIDVRIHFIRELISTGILDVCYVPTELNDADILTKPLGRKLLETAKSRLGVVGSNEEEC